MQAIKELCDGNPSQQTHAFLRSLDRPIAAQEEPIMLFGTNFDVDFWNQEKIDAMPAEARHYRSQDTKMCLKIKPARKQLRFVLMV